ncbi:MAG: oligosaccharide repeat unit polymerase [Elusimicrobiaceae bacterium]|nr:oligosaccharide repeat unit polymerase [Elusimicrobiaceae bacterium]
MSSGISFSKIISILLSVVVLIIIIFMFSITTNFNKINIIDLSVLATFIFNGLIWLFLLIKETNKRPFSLMMINWAFCILFFFMAPVVQYTNFLFPWVGNRSDDIILYANICLFVWTIFIIIGSFFAKRSKTNNLKNAKTIYLSFSLILILTIFNILIMFWNVYNVGFANIFSRATRSFIILEERSITILISHLSQAIAYFAFIYALLYVKKNRKGFLFMFINGIALLISCFPTALSRHAAAVIYFGILLISTKLFRIKGVFLTVLLFSFIIVFPFMEVFRNLSIQDIDILGYLSNVFSNISSIWLGGGYDAYSNFTLVIEYVKQYGPTWGYQLLGVLFFFIPRAIWPLKPIGTGAFIASSLGWRFTNISAPLPAEGFINFGIFGLILFAFILGYAITRADEYYWKNMINGSKENITNFSVIYPVCVMFLFFIYRGDLLSSYAYLMAYIFVWFVISRRFFIHI